MDECWAPAPTARPAFADVNEKLDEVLVDAAINDEQGRDFWKKNFLKHRFVSWEDFSKALYKYVGAMVPIDDAADPKKKKGGTQVNVNVGADVLRMRCAREAFALLDSSKERNQVEIQHFGRVIDWFGPLKAAKGSGNILSTIEEICREDWFHGDIDAIESNRRLDKSSVGTYLVRYSTSSPGGFTISRVTDRGIIHSKVERTSNHGFFVNEEFKTLPELIRFVSPTDKLDLVTPCGGSRFAAVFHSDVQAQPVYAPIVKRPGK